MGVESEDGVERIVRTLRVQNIEEIKTYVPWEDPPERVGVVVHVHSEGPDDTGLPEVPTVVIRWPSGLERPRVGSLLRVTIEEE